MAKVRGRLTNKKRIGPAVFSKRTIPGSRTQGVHYGARKKSGGDNFEENVRSIGLKSKKRKKK